MKHSNFETGQALPFQKAINIVTYPKIEDKLWKMLSQYISAFLNQRGGKIIVGVSSNFQVSGIAYDNQTVDYFKLLVDNHQNGISPQVNAKLIQTDFFTLKDKAELAYVIIDVKPGDQRLYFTSTKSNQAFILTSCGPRVLRRQEVTQRLRNDKETCLQIEEFQEEFKIFKENEDEIQEFLSEKVNQTKVIVVQGKNCTGKTTLVQRYLDQQIFEDSIIYQLNINHFTNTIDLFIQLIRQIDSTFDIGSISTDSTQYFQTFANFQFPMSDSEDSDIKVDEVNQNVKIIHNKEILDEILVSSKQKIDRKLEPLYFSPPSTYFNIYYQLLRKQSLQNKGKKIIICLFCANRTVTQLIPGGLDVIVFITSSKPLYVQQTPAVNILKLERQPFTVTQLVQYYKCTDKIDLEDHICRQLLNITGGDLSKINQLVQQHQQGLDKFILDFSKKSIRYQKAYFASNNYNEIPKELLNYLAPLSIFPSFFSLDMFEHVLEQIAQRMSLQVSSDVPNKLSQYLIRHHDKISLAQNFGSQVLAQVQSDFGKISYEVAIDCIIIELGIQNSIYNNLLESNSHGKLSGQEQITNSVAQLQLNIWIADYGQTLESMIQIAIDYGYKIQELCQLVDVYAFLKIDPDLVRKLRQANRKCQTTSV